MKGEGGGGWGKENGDGGEGWGGIEREGRESDHTTYTALNPGCVLTR